MYITFKRAKREQNIKKKYTQIKNTCWSVKQF